MKLNIHTANLIKDTAYQIDEAILCNGCINHKYPGTHSIKEYTDRRKKAIKQAIINCHKIRRHYNMSSNKFNKIIFDLVCAQFVNSEIFSKGEDFDENQDGLYHPKFDTSWSNTIDGYQLYLRPTKEIISDLVF